MNTDQPNRVNVDHSTISVPGDWCAALPSSSRLLDALQRAATAEARALHLRVEWPWIGRYQACGELGKGGMSTVWKAHDAELGRRVAIKLLRPELAREHGVRLRREAQALARLSHPNVVQVYEAIQVEGLTALVRELVEGMTLRQWQERAPRPSWRECIEVYLQAGHGLAAVHAVGLAHRDVKPANCVIDAEGRVRVLDFGLVARTTDDETVEDAARTLRDDALEVQVTRTGTCLGTMAYMPPERLGGVPGASAAGDQFSFCTSLYEAIYGERPFGGSTEWELAEAIERGCPRPVPKGVRVPARVRAILVRGLAVDPRRRWPSMAALLAELEAATRSRARRWRWLAVAMASAVASLTTAAASRAGEEPPCSGAEVELHGTWDLAQRRAVEAAILGAGTQHASDTWARIEPSLDDYARGWVAKHTEVCEATRVSGAQTEEHMGLRMRCLSRHRAALQEVVGVLRHADEATRAGAMELVASLPGLSQCDDLDALEAELPLPEGPWQAAVVDAARARIARMRALREAGVHPASEADADGIVEQAEELGYEPLLVEALLERGEVRVQLGRSREAEVDLERAHRTALRIEHRYVETRAASVLARLVSEEPRRLDQAERWGESALALAQRRGIDRLLLAEASSALGHVRMMKGWLTNKAPQRQVALELHRRSLVLYEGALGSKHPAIAAVLEAVGDVLMKQKEPDQALEHYARALAVHEALLGASHPAVAGVLTKMGEALARQDEPDMALEHYARALEIQRAALGGWHPSIARTWTRLGIAIHMQGRLDEALALHRHALDIQRLGERRDRLEEIGVVSEVGFVLRDQGRMMEAVTLYEESIELRDVVFGSSGSAAGFVLRRIGDELRERGLLDAAEDYYRESLARYEVAVGPEHHVFVATLVTLAEVAMARGDWSGAVEHAERVSSMCEAAPSHGGESCDRAKVVVERARVHTQHHP